MARLREAMEGVLGVGMSLGVLIRTTIRQQLFPSLAMAKDILIEEVEANFNLRTKSGLEVSSADRARFVGLTEGRFRSRVRGGAE